MTTDQNYDLLIYRRPQTNNHSSKIAYICFKAIQNIALNKPVTMSSQHEHGFGLYAVDGNSSPHYFNDGCAHTIDFPGSTDPWLTVDFGETKTVIGVDIVNRGDCCGKCLYNFPCLYIFSSLFLNCVPLISLLAVLIESKLQSLRNINAATTVFQHNVRCSMPVSNIILHVLLHIT